MEETAAVAMAMKEIYDDNIRMDIKNLKKIYMYTYKEVCYLYNREQNSRVNGSEINGTIDRI